MFNPCVAVYSYNLECDGNNFGAWNTDIFFMGKILLSVHEWHVPISFWFIPLCYITFNTNEEFVTQCYMIWFIEPSSGITLHKFKKSKYACSMHHCLVRSHWCTNIYYSVPYVCSITLNQVFASCRISSLLCFLFEWWLYLVWNQYSVFSSVVQNIVYWFHLCCHNYLNIKCSKDNILYRIKTWYYIMLQTHSIY